MMARWFTVLLALVAQGMALVSPVCFVRCVGADGHECVELTGQGCHCCDVRSHERLTEVCAVATCGHHHEDEEQAVEEQAEQAALAGWQIRGEHCSCQHSPMDSAPQLRAKSLASERPTPLLDSMTTRDFVGIVRALHNVSLSASVGLRPHESPQLAVLATVVLRV
ncbi:MAG: hypothetical protein ACKV2Q_20735 [Planctomycetaceae bacterium]